MPRTASTRRWVAQDDHPTCHPDHLLPDLQPTLAALADVELRDEEARSRLEHEPSAVRALFLVEIEARYQRERQACIERLEQLQEWIGGWLTPGF